MAEPIQLKTCSKCRVEKAVTEFYKQKDRGFGVTSQCKQCQSEYRLANKRKRSEYAKRYYLDNKTMLDNKANKYRSENHELVLEQKKQYRIRNNEKVIAGQKRHYYANQDRIRSERKEKYNQNKDSILKSQKEYYEKNKTEISKRVASKVIKPSKSKKLFDQIPITDKPKINSHGYITIQCYFCHQRFVPSTRMINARISCIRGYVKGEANFYCCDSHKQLCPTYYFDPTRQVDPRSKLYVPPTESQQARAAQTDELKKAQCREVGYNYCERCDDIIDVELHHTLPVSEYGMESVENDSHILLCPGCHVALHRECV